MRSNTDELDDRRASLRDELQHAFGAWLMASGRGETFAEVRGCVDTSGCGDQCKAEWFDYLGAKRRLTLAYAEQRKAA
jgi:hypothetical protein